LTHVNAAGTPSAQSSFSPDQHIHQRRSEVRKALMFVAPVLAATLAGATAEAGDIAAGYKHARQVCAKCHVVATGVGGGGTDGAPPFATIPNELKRTEAQIKTFLMRPHGRMPDFVMTRQEIDDLAAYIMSLHR
jgi:mono/diheme cytochrome c family protein